MNIDYEKSYETYDITTNNHIINIYFKKVENNIKEITNSFNTIDNRRITNGPLEKMDKDGKTIFRLSFGSRNFIKMRNKLLWMMSQYYIQ